MNKLFCKGGAERDALAVSLCYSSATLTCLEALHTNCLWMGLDAEQSFALSAALATVSVFLGTLVLVRRLAKPTSII